MASSRDILQFVFEYRRLLAKKDMLGRNLDTVSRNRLRALEKLFAADPAEARKGRPRRRHARVDVRVRASVKAGGRIEPVEVVNIGGGGLCVSPAPSLAPGERAVVRIPAQDSTREYHYPVAAGWAAGEAKSSTMGLPFVGMPIKADVAQQ